MSAVAVPAKQPIRSTIPARLDPGDPGPLAIVDGRIWVGTLHDTGTVARVTVLATNGRVVATIALPDQPAVNIVPSPGGGAWVTFGANNTVSPAGLRLSGR
jgi:hypothetical protein